MYSSLPSSHRLYLKTSHLILSLPPTLRLQSPLALSASPLTSPLLVSSHLKISLKPSYLLLSSPLLPSTHSCTGGGGGVGRGPSKARKSGDLRRSRERAERAGKGDARGHKETEAELGGRGGSRRRTRSFQIKSNSPPLRLTFTCLCILSAQRRIFYHS
jgi:hypothetical protein